MTSWSTEQLDSISSHPDLFVAPFRNDGSTYGTYTQTWALVVDGKVYVRAATGTKSSWYRAALEQGAGGIRVGDDYYDVTFDDAGTSDESAIDAAYEQKYPGSSAVPVMQGSVPKTASVLISPR